MTNNEANSLLNTAEHEDMRAVKVNSAATSAFTSVKLQGQQQQTDNNGGFTPVKVQQNQPPGSLNGASAQAIPVAVPAPSSSSASSSGQQHDDESKRGETLRQASSPSSPPTTQHNPPPVEIPFAREIADPNFTPLDYVDALILHLILGWFGGLHFRMGRFNLGLIYFFTVGGFGLGYLVDLIRLHFLVDEYNQKKGKLLNRESHATLVWDSYALWLLGFFGMNHFYLKRWNWGLFYFFTVGGFGLGWVLDLIRIPFLVSDYIEKRDNPANALKPKRISTMDVYLLWFPPLGLLGFHRLYLGDTSQFVLYFFTLGLFGLGWLADFFRIPELVNRYNARNEIVLDDINFGIRDARLV